MRMARILFVIPNIVGDKAAATAPLPGVAYIAGVVRAAGYEVAAQDMRVEPSINSLFKKIREFKPDFIGLSFMAMEFQQVYDFVEVLKREFPDIPLVMGGSGSSTFEEQVLKKTKVEYIITREGEQALAELLSGKQQSKIKGLIYMKDGAIKKNPTRPFQTNLDKLPFPAYDIFPLEKYADSKIPIVTSRGCPYSCTFCAMKASMGPAFRARSAENVVAEVEYWYGKGYRYFHIVDDNFTFDMNRAERFCDLVIEKGMTDIKWDLRNGVRCDKLNENLLRKMKQAGCFYLALGIESLDQQVLDRMKKNLRVEDVKNAVEALRKAGIPFGGFFIVGLLDDTFNKFLKSYEFARTAGFEEVRFYNPIPFPGTELYQELEDRNLLRYKPEEYLNTSSKTFSDEPIFTTPEFTVEERRIALRMGQKLMMQKILVKEFGSLFGGAAFLVWLAKPLRSLVMKPGAVFWKMVRRSKRKIVCGT